MNFFSMIIDLFSPSMFMLDLYYRIPLEYEMKVLKSIKNHITMLWAELTRMVSTFGFPPTNSFFMFLVGTVLLSKISICKFYHFMRVQSLMKMYVVYNFLEVVEKLVITILHDFDKYNKKHFTMLKYILHAVFVYVHALILYAYFITLYVTINSNINTYYALLIGTNFVELRTVLFRKCTSEMLIANMDNDIVRRFYTIKYLILVCICSLADSHDKKYVFLKFVLCYYVSKMVVEWIKYVFIHRYNPNICFAKEISTFNVPISAHILFTVILWQVKDMYMYK